MSQRWPYPISKAALASHVTKLHLEPGDVLLVKSPQVMEALSRVQIPLKFNVPLVFLPSGDLHTLKRADLLNLLEQLDAAEAPVLVPDTTSAPL